MEMMAKKSTTYKGQAKPFGKSGHYYEPRRHELQARGIKTGNLANKTPVPKQEPLIDLGMLPDETYKQLEKEEEKLLSDDEEKPQAEYSYVIEEAQAPVEPEIAGAEEVEIEKGEIEVKKPSRGFLGELLEGFKAEKSAKSEKLKLKAKKELGEDVELDEFESPDFPTRGAKFGKMLADLFGDYRSEDFNELNDAQLEELAIKFDSSAGGLLGKPANPFLEELKKRIKSREYVKYEKAKIDAELEPSRMRIQQEIDEIRRKAQKKAKGSDGDFIERIFGV